MKRIAAVFLILSILSLSGCANLSKNTELIGKIIEKLNGNTDVAAEEPEELKQVRSKLVEYDTLLGVAYLGYYDSELSYDNMITAVTATDSCRTNPFISLVTEDNYIVCSGYNMYSFVTAYPEAVMTVYDCYYDENSENYMSKGEVIQQITNGSPIIIVGMESEIMPNICITVETPGMQSIEYYPMLSGEDGSVVCPEFVFDLTEYGDPNVNGGSASAGGVADWISGIWYGETKSDDGDIAHIIQIYEDGTASYFIGYVNSEIELAYNGQWYDNESGGITFDLVGGPVTYTDDGTEYDDSDSFNGSFEWSLTNGYDLKLKHNKGTPLISTDDYAAVTFSQIIEDAVG